MKKEKSAGSKIFSIVYTIVLVVIIGKLYGIYKLNNFGDFKKAERINQQDNISKISKFTRDCEVKYSNSDSYKIESSELNDAMFYKTINVKKNTPYRISCMVKTDNVELEYENSDAGATISIVNSTEISQSIVGTNDWQKLEFIFNSANRETIDIGFRLGGNTSRAKGIAWFSDFKLEEGISSKDSNWKMGCFIFKSIDVLLEGKNIALNMRTEDIELIYDNMRRFKNACEELSNYKMTVEYDIHEINEKLTTVSYEDEHGHYIDPYDVSKIIGETILENEYDHVFVAIRMGSEEQDLEIAINDWIGLRRNDFIWSRFF